MVCFRVVGYGSKLQIVSDCKLGQEMSDVLVDFLSKTQWVNTTRGVNPDSDGVKVSFWVYKPITPENVEFRPRSCVDFFHVHFFLKEKEWMWFVDGDPIRQK